MNTPLIPLLLLSLPLLGVALPVHAEKADRGKPMQVEADSLRYDDLRQVSVFSGRVQLSKGSIVIRGEQIEVRQDPDGYQFGSVTGSAGQPAFYRQKREGLDEYIEGEADSIRYDGRADSVTFNSKARLRRYRGSVLADEISGGSIVYSNLTDQFTVDGNSANAPSGGGRVHVILSGKPEHPASASRTPGGGP